MIRGVLLHWATVPMTTTCYARIYNRGLPFIFHLKVQRFCFRCSSYQTLVYINIKELKTHWDFMEIIFYPFCNVTVILFTYLRRPKTQFELSEWSFHLNFHLAKQPPPPKKRGLNHHRPQRDWLEPLLTHLRGLLSL